MQLLPSYEEVSRGFGFPVPRQYYKFLELAFQLSPSNPANAFEPLGVCSLDASLANPKYSYSGHDYADTPVEIYVMGWTGTDGGHYGFVVDDIPSNSVDLPIAEVYPNSGCRLLGMNMSEFISVSLSESLKEDGVKWYDKNHHMMRVLQERLHCCVLEDIETHLLQTRIDRIRSGAVMTLDGCGILVPKDQVDLRAWEAINWETHSVGRAVPEHILVDAERRIAQGDYITAYLIARNFRYLYWHRDFDTDRAYIRRTADIMERAYIVLGRAHLAKKIRAQTDWAIKNVL